MDDTKGTIILSCNNNGERICAASARISTQTGDAVQIYEASSDDEKNRSLVKKVMNLGHTSVAEHMVFNIAFCNVSVFVEQFMIEFRLASFMVKSRRYVDFSNTGFYTPQGMDIELLDIYKNHMSRLFDLYGELVKNGVPKEDARFVLPYCFYSNFYVTVNARQLLHILDEMLNGRGVGFSEVEALGHQLLEQAIKVSPAFFEEFEVKPRCKIIQNEHILSNQEAKEQIEILSYSEGYKNSIILAHQMATGELLDDDGIEKLVRSGTSPRVLEHFTCTVRMNGLTLSAITHMVRHRMQSITVPPLTAVNRQDYIVPKTIPVQLLDKYNEAFRSNYRMCIQYKDSINVNDLVYFNLSGNKLDILTTINGRELLLFFKLRTCDRAQWEIKEYATDLLNKLRKISPELFDGMGPSCYVTSKCPEGRQSCGNKENVVKRFARN